MEKEEDVVHQIKASWLKWRNASSELCYRRIPTKPIMKCCRMVIGPTKFYGSECSIGHK